MIRTVEAFPSFAPSAGDDRTTDYASDGSDQPVP